MGITEKQDLESRKQESQEWTSRALFPFASATKALSKVFTNPFDIMLGFLIIIIGISELFGRQISGFVFFIIALILIASVFERNKNLFLGIKEDETKK